MPVDIEAVKGADIFQGDIKEAAYRSFRLPAVPEFRIIGIGAVHQMGGADQKVKGEAFCHIPLQPGIQKSSQAGLKSQLGSDADLDPALIEGLKTARFREIGRGVQIHTDIGIRIIRVKMFCQA